MDSKLCRGCGVEKSIDDFYVSKIHRGKTFYRGVCKICFNLGISPSGMGKKLSSSQISDLRSMYLDGVPLRTIAKSIGCSTGSVGVYTQDLTRKITHKKHKIINVSRKKSMTPGLKVPKKKFSLVEETPIPVPEPKKINYDSYTLKLRNLVRRKHSGSLV